MGAEQTYETFLRVCPLRREAYDPTPENVRRWEWHIRQAEARPKGQPVECDSDPLRILQLLRRVEHFAGFPLYARLAYAKIAGRFPGHQVWACGSRVRGDYMEGVGDTEAVAARAAAGMRDKQESDFDFWALPDAQQAGELPKWADRCRVRVPEKQKIPIPMWDFDKLPLSEHRQVAEWIVRGDWGKLAAIHDRYALSPHSYCCDPEGLKNWFWWGLKNGKIIYDNECSNGAGESADAGGV